MLDEVYSKLDRKKDMISERDQKDSLPDCLLDLVAYLISNLINKDK